jgi:AcrR family transcriptional regulator
MTDEPTAKPSTRERIIEAALDTVGEEGFAATTARSIAKRGDFNQALIFYHFGSVPALLMEAFGTTSAAQVAKYREAAAGVSSLEDLVAIARRLHSEDLESGSVTAVTQLMAAAASDVSVGHTMLDRFDEWIGIVQEALERAISAHPLAAMVPAREAAYAICAMFLGIELMSRLDPERSEAEAVFDMMGAIAAIVQEILPAMVEGTSVEESGVDEGTTS